MHSNDLLNRLRICLRDGKIAEAEAILEENPNNGSVVRFFAVHYFQKGEENKAFRLIEIFRGTEQGGENYYHPEVCGVYAKYLWGNKKQGDARDLLKEVIDAGRANGHTCTMYAGMVEPDVAIEVLEQARERQPELEYAPNVCNKLAQLYERKGQAEKGAELLKKLIDAGNAGSHTYTIYAGMADRDEAILVLENVIRTDEFYYDTAVCNKLAKLYIARNKGWDRYEAKLLLEELIDSGHADSRIYMIYSSIVDIDTALNAMNAAPRSVIDQVLHDRSKSLVDTKGAVTNTFRRLQRESEQIEIPHLYAYAATLAHKEKFQEAIDLTQGVDDPQVMALRGLLYAKMGEGGKALHELTKAFVAEYEKSGEPNWFALITITDLARMGAGVELYKKCMTALGDKYDIPFLKIENYPAEPDMKALGGYMDAPIRLPRYDLRHHVFGVADGGVEDEQRAVRSR